MIVIPDKKLLLLLPWKTASQTLRARLKGINQPPYPAACYFNPFLNRVVHQHITLADYFALPEKQQGYSLAVFVRNPYDRVFSGFQQIIRDFNRHPQHNYPAPWIKDLIVEQIADLYHGAASAQFNINTWFQSIPAHLVVETGRNICLSLHPAHYWTHHNGEQAAHFIGKVENFEKDFTALCARHDITPASSENANQSATDLATPDAHGYKYASHLNAKTIARINELFKNDFDYFGYQKL